MAASLARTSPARKPGWRVEPGLPATCPPRESPAMSKSVIGDSPKRREDARFITGRGAYVDDLVFDGLSRAVFVRSPQAHARIRSIDASAARKAPGVLAVLTAAEARADGLKQLRPYAEANVQTGERFIFDEQPLLAGDKVRFMGETVAMVIAETLAQALDAAEM